MHSESREDGSHDFIDFSGRVMIWNAIPSVIFEASENFSPFPHQEIGSGKVYKNCEHGGLSLDINAFITLLGEETGSDSGNHGGPVNGPRVRHSLGGRYVPDNGLPDR